MADGRHDRRKLIEGLVSVEPGTLGFHLRHYLRMLEIRNYSKGTLRARESHLRYFLLWCDQRGIARPDEVNVALMERFQRHLYYYRTAAGKPLSFGSQGSRLHEISRFYLWMMRSRIVEANPADALLMTIAVYSDVLPIGKVDDYVENYLAPEIARVQGVGL